MDILHEQAAMPPQTTHKVLSGLDGFVDEIIHVVDKRIDADHYTRIEKIADYGQRIVQAAGLSCNIENVVVQQKMGGNGPIFAYALQKLGLDVTYMGAVGDGIVEEVFAPLAQHARILPLAAPAHTDAIEFFDGKLICSKLSAFRALTWDRIVERIGVHELTALIDEADILSFNNWTMVLDMNNIWKHLLQDVFPLTKKSLHGKTIFFDLADPKKRSSKDLLTAIRMIQEFEHSGPSVILGLNYKEALQIYDLLLPAHDTANITLCSLTTTLGSLLGVSCLLVHRHRIAACYAAQNYYEQAVPYCETPKLTTGAGDNFNAGFLYAYANAMPPAMCLKCAIATAGYYVRNAASPTSEQMEQFISQWEIQS